MPDPEVRWIPEENAQAASVRMRVISLTVLAVSCLLIGVVIGRLTAGISTVTRSGPLDIVSVPPPKKAAAADVERSSLALKSDLEASAEKAASPSTQAASETIRPPVVLLNPGTADKSSRPAREKTRAGSEPMRESSAPGASRKDRERAAADDRTGVVSPPARDYQSLREHMLSK